MNNRVKNGNLNPPPKSAAEACDRASLLMVECKTISKNLKTNNYVDYAWAQRAKRALTMLNFELRLLRNYIIEHTAEFFNTLVHDEVDFDNDERSFIEAFKKFAQTHKSERRTKWE
jgi:hypothetical protein